MKKSHQFLALRLAKRQREDGVAIIIVLALLVLLTGVVVAYLSRSNTDLRVSTSSLNQAKVDILAKSAMELIIAEAQKDIVDGSQPVANGIYVPKTPQDMVLKRLLKDDDAAASLAEEAAYPNLVRISRKATGATTAGKMVSPGSSVASTAESLNKRSISTKRWNAHYLLQPAVLPPTDAGVLDPTPSSGPPSSIPAFPVPYWVNMTTTGPQWINALTPDIGKTVIGRYAFAIYNEGGLLDANVAGYPEVSNGTAGGKNSTAYADLTQLPLRNNSRLAQDEIKKLAGWRNKGATQATGDVTSGYQFLAAQNGIENFHHNVVDQEVHGYMTVEHAGDQRFLSRQALIKFWERTGLKKEALQYFTSYSRSLEQPSLIANAATVPGWTVANSAETPSFVSLNGTGGNPLILKRFPLRRLAWLTPGGPSNNTVDAGVFRTALRSAGFTDEELNNGTPARIEESFGLQWGSGVWQYVHGNTILTLDQVPNTRKPNFFELLKAAIPKGALRHGGAPSTGLPATNTAYNEYQSGMDESLDRAIFQIGANIIDQYDIDSFPTRISFGSGATAYTVAGVESLPYIYGTRQGIVQVQAPTASVAPSNNAAPAVGTVTTPGSVASMLFPILWNPHLQTATNPSTGAGLMPNVRFVVSADHPLFPNSGAAVTLTMSSNSGPAPTGSTRSGSTAQTFDDNNTQFGIGVSVAGAFATPKMLWQEENMIEVTSAHALASVTGVTSTADGIYLTPLGSTIPSPSPHVIGVVLGESPLQWTVSDNSTDPPTLTVHTAKSVTSSLTAGTVSTDSALSLKMEYQTSVGSNWVPYDEKFAPVVGTQPINWDHWEYGLLSTQLMNWSIAVDPRPSKFGMYSLTGGGAPDATIPADNTVNLAAAKGLHGWHGTALIPWQLAINDGANALVDRDGITRAGMAMGVAVGSSTNPLAAISAVGANEARPYILNRPFNSVAELGYVFSGTPWRNLDMASPQSGYSRLLDLFCLNEMDVNSSQTPIIAGKVDLNTRQTPVLTAILAGTFRNNQVEPLDPAIAQAVAEALVTWTKDTVSTAAGTAGPLIERSDLVSRYDSTRTVPYRGFTTRLASLAPIDAAYARYREASIRALANNGQTRVWNLMVDLVVQTGRYGVNETTLARFNVEGERRLWVHLAIDRLTGKVIDKQVEVVTE